MEGGRRWVSIPSEDVMCVEALESTTQGELPCSCMFCRAAMRPAASQVLVEVLEPLEDAWSGAKAVLRPAGAPGPPGALAALSRRGDALSRGYTFAGPGIEAPGSAFVGAGTAGVVGEAAGGVWEGLLGALFGVRAPATLLLLLLLETTIRGGSSQEGGGSTRLFVVLQPQLLQEELMACGGEGEGLLSGDVVGDARVDLVESAPHRRLRTRLGSDTGCPTLRSSSAFSFMRTQ